MNTRPKPSVVIFAKSVPKLADFYRAIAEMTVVHHDKDHVVLDQEGFQVVIHGIPKAISAQIHIAEPPQVREETPIKICLPVASIGNARTKAAELGGNVKPKGKEWEGRGFRACDGYDPEGNVFQVRERGTIP
jgi:predicted enzyme related to lactoylglutathione lyase